MCDFEGCSNPKYCKGYCTAHYQQLRSGRNLRKVPWTDEDRFFSRVSKSEGGCWLWTGATNHGGYGKFSVGRRTVSAHRYSFSLHFGRDPGAGLQLDHLCHVRNCVNPAHLRESHPSENQENRTPSPMRNIGFDPGRGKYVVRVEKSGVNHFGGRFSSLEEARKCAENLRMEVFSEYYAKARRFDPGRTPQSASRPEQ